MSEDRVLKVGEEVVIKDKKYKITGICQEKFGLSDVTIYYLDDGSEQLVVEDYRGQAGPHGRNYYLSKTRQLKPEELDEELKKYKELERGKIKIVKIEGEIPFLVGKEGEFISCLPDKTWENFVMFEIYENLVLMDKAHLLKRRDISSARAS